MGWHMTKKERGACENEVLPARPCRFPPVASLGPAWQLEKHNWAIVFPGRGCPREGGIDPGRLVEKEARCGGFLEQKEEIVGKGK